MTNLRRRIAVDTRYVLTGFPLAVIGFCLVVTGIAAGVGSAVAFVGLPVLAATALMARRFADVERAALPEVLGRPIARPEYREAPVWAGWFRRTMNPVINGQAPMDLLHAVLSFPIAIASFVFTVVWWAGTLAGLTFPLYGWVLAGIPGFTEGGLPALLGFGTDAATFVTFNTVVGVLFALTLVPVLRGAALVKATLAQAMLTRPAYAPRAGLGHAATVGVS
ncbi:sensor domain-containing protein [Nonomuraea sp. SBT364]|uniref:sensor domain-containing protein n=1 Tax=Nonomuraea sp. SBT364 TaxID=1580530 RepID=UPI00069EBAF3|nr:sensor domain-containing protein [Nonomuraea sp. SBT364]